MNDPGLHLPEHLDLIAAAPDGIRKLRGLILELVVRGKLVALKKVESTNLGAIGKWAVGSGFPTSEQGLTGLEILFAKVSDMNLPGNGKFIVTANNTISRESAKRLKVNVHPAGTVVFPKIGGAIATHKRRILVRDTAIDNNCLGIIPKDGISSEWLFVLLSAIDFTKYQAGTSVPALAQGVLAEIPVLLPSESDQSCIVAKVDELMALCDRLDAEQADTEAAHAKLVATLLGTLTQSTDAAELAVNWQRLAEHFDTLFTTDASLDTLKQTILQLAVMGKLVPQDINDEPAHGKLGDFVEFLNGYAFKSEGFTKAGVRLLRNANVAHGYCDWKDAAHVAGNREDEFKKFALSLGDLVLSLDRPLINTGLKIARISERDLPCLLLQRVARVSPRSEALMSEYLFMWLNSPAFTRTIDPGRSNGVPHISTRQVADIPFILYSVEEQHRIVAKVDELMALCDRLKADLAESRARQQRLATTLIESALEAA